MSKTTLPLTDEPAQLFPTYAERTASKKDANRQIIMGHMREINEPRTLVEITDLLRLRGVEMQPPAVRGAVRELVRDGVLRAEKEHPVSQGWSLTRYTPT